MADFLLIHGSCHGAWCWRDVIPALKGLGHSARAIDLPGGGEDDTPMLDITLEGSAQHVAENLGHSTIVVGHSYGGYPITAAAELAPEQIAKLVYLCAYVPVPGRTMIDRRKEAQRQPLLAALEKTPDGLAFTAKRDKIADIFFHDCPPEAVAFAVPRLRPQAIDPQDTVVELTEASRSLPRAYIRCTEDRTIPPEFQVTMTEDWPRDTVFDLPSGHSPFLSMPDRLAAMLDHIASET